jgi:hypothetical protein
MKVLHLTLKKKWFDMIASGEKKEEYRAIKPYWNRRFYRCLAGSTRKQYFGDCQELKGNVVVNTFPCYKCDHAEWQSYDVVQFRNGYSKQAPVMLVELCWVSRGLGKKEWGVPDHSVYILKLGRIITAGQKQNAAGPAKQQPTAPSGQRSQPL